MKTLREDIAELQELIFTASAYRGPEPGNSRDLGPATPVGVVGPDPDEEKKMLATVKKRKIKADLRAKLRRIATWRD